jgi:hypothetical protein
MNKIKLMFLKLEKLVNKKFKKNNLYYFIIFLLSLY